MNQSGSVAENESELMVRGLLYGVVARWTAERFGEEKFKSFLATLPKEYSHPLANFEKKEWYPAIQVYPVYEYLIDFLSGEMNEAEVITGIVNFMFSQALTGFMKGLLSFLTPARLQKRATSFWLRVHSQGRIECTHAGKNHLNVQLHDWKIHRISCLIFAGWMKQLVMLTGGKDVEVKEIHCALDGGGPCQLEAKYK